MVKIVAHDGFPRWTESGADFLEVDVRRSERGELILSHDPRPAGTVTPTLDQALRTGRPLQLDLKEPGFEVELVGRSLRSRATEHITVTTAEDESITAVKERFPDVRAGLTLAERPTERTWSRIERCHADFVAVDHRYAEWYRSPALKVWLWTVDDERLLTRYLDEGWPKAIITNRPDVALRLRAKRPQAEAD